MPQKSLDIIMSSASPSFESVSVPATNSATVGSWFKGPSNILSLFGLNRCKMSCVRSMNVQAAHQHVQDTTFPHYAPTPLEHTTVLPPELNNVNNTGMTAFFSGAHAQPMYPGHTKLGQNPTTYQHSYQSTALVELSNNLRNSAQFCDFITPGGSNMANGTLHGLSQYANQLKDTLLSWSSPTPSSTTWVNPAWLSSSPMSKMEQKKQRLAEQTAWPVDVYNHQEEKLLAPPQHVTSKAFLGGSDASGGSRLWYNMEVLGERQENLLPFHATPEQSDMFLCQQQQQYQLYQRLHQQKQQQQSGYNQSQQQQESYQCYQVPHLQGQSTLAPTNKMKGEQLPWGELAVFVLPSDDGVGSNPGRRSAVQDTAVVYDSAGMRLFASSSDVDLIVSDACSHCDSGSEWSVEPWSIDTERCNSFEGEEMVANTGALKHDDTGGNSCLPVLESTLDPNAKEWTGTGVPSRGSNTRSSGSVGSSKLNPEAKEWVPKNVVVHLSVGAENNVKDDSIFVLKREEECKSREANKNSKLLSSLNFDGGTCTDDCFLLVDLRNSCGAPTAAEIDCIGSSGVVIEEKSTQAKPTSVSEINKLHCNISEILLCNSSNLAAIVPCSSFDADDGLGDRDEVDCGVHENLTASDILPCKDVHVENTSDSGHVNNNNNNTDSNSIGALCLQFSLSCSSLADNTLPENDEDDDDGVVFEHDEDDGPCAWLAATDDDSYSCVSDASSDSDSEEEDSSGDENDFITFSVTAAGRVDASSDDDSDEDDVILSSCRELCDGGSKAPAPAKSWFIGHEVINPKESGSTLGESDSEEEEQHVDDDDWNTDDESCDSGTGRISAEDWAFGENLVSCKTSIAKQLQLLAHAERERKECVAKVEKANQRWISQTEGDCLVNCCTRRCDKTVRFSDDVDVTYIEPLMTYILNGIRFRRHVQNLSEVLTPVLLSEHRNRVYAERFDEGQCTEKGDGGMLKKPAISSNCKSLDVSVVVGACKNVRINGYR